ncbi:MAG: nucleotidyltransferase domain-containing protein [Eubacterium sp.]|nr:nucleotidyltransferase domain-containing protein [Eubacterium sp.]
MDRIYAIDEISSIITPILEKFEVERVWLFGSYARGDASENSDIDLRIEGGQIRGMFGLGMLYDELTSALCKSVDLITTEGLNHKANSERTKEFRINIGKDEKLIYESKRS